MDHGMLVSSKPGRIAQRLLDNLYRKAPLSLPLKPRQRLVDRCGVHDANAFLRSVCHRDILVRPKPSKTILASNGDLFRPALLTSKLCRNSHDYSKPQMLSKQVTSKLSLAPLASRSKNKGDLSFVLLL